MDDLTFDVQDFAYPVRRGDKKIGFALARNFNMLQQKAGSFDDLVELEALQKIAEELTSRIKKLKAERQERVVSEENPLLNVAEVAQILRVSEQTVREEVNSGKIISSKIGDRSQIRILSSDLAKYLGVKKIIFTKKDAA